MVVELVRDVVSVSCAEVLVPLRTLACSQSNPTLNLYFNPFLARRTTLRAASTLFLISSAQPTKSRPAEQMPFDSARLLP